MRRGQIAIVFVVLVCFAFACNSETGAKRQYVSEIEPEECNSIGSPENEYDQTEFFYVSERAVGEYEYHIFNREGDVVYCDLAYRLQPSIHVIDGYLVWIEVGVGTATTQVRFYDLDSDCLSRWYDTPRAAKDNLVILMEWDSEGKPVCSIREIFSGNLVGEFRREFSPVANLGGALSEAEFLSDNRVRINYLFGNDYLDMEEIICFESVN